MPKPEMIRTLHYNPAKLILSIRPPCIAQPFTARLPAGIFAPLTEYTGTKTQSALG